MSHPLRGRPLLCFALTLSLGAMTAAWTPLWLALSLFALPLLVRRPLITACALFALLGALRWSVQARVPSDDVSQIPVPLQTTLMGTVETEPVVRTGDHPSMRFVLRVRSIGGTTASGWVLARFSGEKKAPALGQVISLTGKLDEPTSHRSPGSLDYKALLLQRGISRELISNKMVAVPNSQSAVWMLVSALRTRFRNAMSANLPAPEANLACGLVMGLQTDVSPQVRTEMRVTGTFHLLSVSGFHVAALWLVANFVLAVIGLGRRASTFVILPMLAFYVLLCGADPPVVRAATMLAVFQLGHWFARPPDGLTAIALAAVVFILWNPRDLFGMSFQLSFITVAGMLVWYRSVFGWLQRMSENAPIPLKPIAAKTASVLALSLVAQMASAPLLAYYFGQVSLIAPLANLPLAVVCLTAFWTSALTWFGVPFAAWLAHPALALFLWMTHVFAVIPNAAVWTPSVGWLPAAACYVIGFAVKVK